MTCSHSEEHWEEDTVAQNSLHQRQKPWGRAVAISQNLDQPKYRHLHASPWPDPLLARVVGWHSQMWVRREGD